MPIQEEICFPRGGKESVINKKVSKKTLSFKRKSDGSTDRAQKSAKKSKSSVLIADISSKTLVEGMILLGCVREVNDTEIKVSLPGRIIGYVPATNISTEYSEYLKQLLHGEEKDPQELQHMFKPGQFIVTKVQNVSSVQNVKMKVTLTLNPEVIQSNFSIRDVKKGLILPASVQSIEDHGYIMNCGITNVRAFLKRALSSNFEEVWNDGRTLGIGQVLRCLVVKNTAFEEYSNVELDADPQVVANAQNTDINMPLSSVIPGMCFQMIISKVTPSGLVVKFSGEGAGFVHTNYIPMNFDGEKGSELQGRVLYVEPLTKQVFFTALNNVCGPDPVPNTFIKKWKGRVFKHAKVISSKGGNVVLELQKNKAYGYVSIKHMEIDVHTDVKEDLNKIVQQKYPVESVHKCKVLEYDFMMQKYSCSLKKSIIQEKYLSLDDIQPGQVVKCVVEKSTPREIKLRVGNIRGIVEPIHVTDEPVRYPDTLLLKGQKLKARVLAVKSPICEFTLKPSLVKSQNPVLKEFSEAKCDVSYDGVIVSILNDAVLVKFYGDFKTVVPARKIENGLVGDLNRFCYIGQVVTCLVQKINTNAQKLFMTIQLGLQNQVLDDDSQECGPVKVGECYTVNVVEVSTNGLIVQESASGTTGIIPPTQLTDSPQMATVLCQTYSVGDTLETYCMKNGNNTMFTKSPTLIKYFKSSLGKKITERGLSALQRYMVVVSTVVEVTKEGITVSVPKQGKELHVSVPTHKICDGTIEDSLSLGIQLHQTMFVQITQIVYNAPSLGTCRLSRVWDKTLMIENGILLLLDFLNSQKKIHKFLKNEGHSLGELQVGSQVKGTVVVVTTYGAVVDLLNGIRAVVMPTHYKGLDLEINMSVEGIVLYVDVVKQCVEITLSRDVCDIFSSLGNAHPVEKAAKCLVLISRPEVVLAGVVLGKNTQIVYVPSRWHINDVRPSPYYELGERKKIKIKLYEDGILYAVPRAVEVCEKKEKALQKKTQISEEALEVNETGNSTLSDDVSCNIIENSNIKGGVNVKKKKKKQEKTDCILNGIESHADNVQDSLINGNENMVDHITTDTKKIKKKKKNQNVSDETSKKSEQSPSVPLLSSNSGSHKVSDSKKKESKGNVQKNNVSGSKNLDEEKNTQIDKLQVNAGFFWDATMDQLPNIFNQKAQDSDSNSDDEQADIVISKKKKQRLSMTEKRELARQEEERLRKIEERLMEAEKNPQTADDFDRLVMSAPNNSQNWIKYIAYHLEATEVEKARAVGQRALKTISFREEQEKLNVWMALLNLENLFGTSETLNQTLEEAVKMNDPYKVYMQTLKMYSVTKRFEELEKILQLVTKKFRERKNMWIEAGMACIKCGEIEKSRQLMQRSLKVLDRRDHVEVLTRFALMENEYGESERAETIMENILTSYPKRTDSWCVYVDMLVKSKKLDLARQVLDRAVIQKLPPMKMKSLFKKYIKFEQDHGTPKQFEKVRDMAKNYVEKSEYLRS